MNRHVQVFITTHIEAPGQFGVKRFQRGHNGPKCHKCQENQFRESLNFPQSPESSLRYMAMFWQNLVVYSCDYKDSIYTYTR